MPERFSASVAGRHMACTGSANLELAIPGWTPPPDQGETPASKKGSAMHQVLEDAGQFTAKEMEAIATAMRYVAELRQTRRFKIKTEHKMVGWWLQSTPTTKADVVLHVADEIHVIDYKMGRIPVEVVGNKQGMFYCSAALLLAPKAKTIRFHIVQPLANNIDSVQFPIAQLRQFMSDTITAESKILGGDTTLTPGDHCQFCPANPVSRGGKGTPSCPKMVELIWPSVVDEDAILGPEPTP